MGNVVEPGERVVKAVFVDADGTLVGQSGRISQRVLEVIAEAKAAGVHIILSTGRTLMTARCICDQMAANNLAIVGNGSIAVDLATGDALWRSVIAREDAVRVINVVWALGLAPLVFEDGMTSNRILYHPERESIYRGDPRLRPHAAITTDLPFDPLCVCVYAHARSLRHLVPEIRDRLPESVQVIEGGTGDYWGADIYPARIGKHVSMEAALTELGLTLADAMAIGDNLNDLEMIERAGIGVAMGNAQPMVKDRADWIAPSLEEDGVAAAIERFVLGPNIDRGTPRLDRATSPQVD